MISPPHVEPATWPHLAWLSALLAAIAGPALAILLMSDEPEQARMATAFGPILAIGLMGAGMIGGATAGRLRIGILLALLTGAGLIGFARTLGMPALLHPTATGLAIAIASISFAARGALFARSASDKGWLVALAVVAGEAAILVTASALPGALPGWLLVLLPAQWARVAIQTSLTGAGAFAAGSELLALGGTAAATLLVAGLWPRRWTYLIMFSAWLGLSALVWHWSAPIAPTSAVTAG